MSGIKALVGKRMTKKVKFMGEDVQITKLTVNQVEDIQEMSKAASEGSEDFGFKLISFVIGAAVEGGSELTEEDLKQFPIDELNKLSEEIMKFSGMGTSDSGSK